MSHRNDDLHHYSSQQQALQNPNSPSPRGYYADHPQALSPLIQHFPPPTTNIASNSASPHPPFHSPSEQSSFSTVDPHLGVLRAYRLGSHPTTLRRRSVEDAHGTGADDYRPGHDPPRLVTPSPYNHSDQGVAQGSWVPDAQPSSPGPSHHGMGYSYAGQWNGQPLDVFEAAFQPGFSGYIAHPVFISPVDGTRWSSNGSPSVGSPGVAYAFSPPAGPPPTPSSALDTRDNLLHSPHGLAPSIRGPFGRFPDRDPARDIAYLGYGGMVDDTTTNEMLGVLSPPNCSCGPDLSSSTERRIYSLPLAIETDCSNRPLEHNQASSSTQVFETPNDLGVRLVQRVENVETHFPDSLALQKLALYLLDQKWCIQNEDEPTIGPGEPVLAIKTGKRNPKSRFEPFFDGKMRCQVIEASGTRCEHVTTRKDRAVGHARAHFEYKPFACGGKCGKLGCHERYTCSSFRNDHVGRKKNPMRPCSICKKFLTAQNLQRHMKQHSPPPSPQAEEPPRKKPKISILRSVARK